MGRCHHHTPFLESIPEEFPGDLLDTCFVNNNLDLDHFPRTGFWIHSYVYTSVGYVVPAGGEHGIWVVCDPLGPHMALRGAEWGRGHEAVLETQSLLALFAVTLLALKQAPCRCRR
jgi:hypothetical protein